MAMPKFGTGTLIAVFLVAIAGLYLFSQLVTTTTTGTDTTYAFNAPTTAELSSMTMWIIKLAIVGAFVWLAVMVVGKLTGGTLGRKDIFTLILIGVGVYFAWNYVIAPVWDASTIDGIAWGVKTALFGP